jgi:L-amino acid N-acyltransferase YncA
MTPTTTQIGRRFVEGLGFRTVGRLTEVLGRGDAWLDMELAHLTLEAVEVNA